MFEILRAAKAESLKKSKEMQKVLDHAGGWDNMVKKAKRVVK